MSGERGYLYVARYDKLRKYILKNKNSIKLIVKNLIRNKEKSWERGEWSSLPYRTVLENEVFELGFACEETPQSCHIHNFLYEIIIVLNKVKITYYNNILDLYGGDLVIIPPKIPHKLKVEDGCVYVIKVPSKPGPIPDNDKLEVENCWSKPFFEFSRS